LELAMPEKPDRPTETTRKGLEVPVPKRGEFFANLKKVAKVAKRSTAAGAKKQ
jgi:hypothetical protein